MLKLLVLSLFFNFFFCLNCAERPLYLVGDVFIVTPTSRLYDLTEELLKKGTDPNHRPTVGHLTPLMWAMKNNHKELAWLLLVYGANPYHVLTGARGEQHWSIETKLYIGSVPWRQNAFMMGNGDMQVWLKDYIEGFEHRQKCHPYFKITHS